MHKLSVEAPPKILVERYLIEIAKNYNVPYEPDAMVRVRFDTLSLISATASDISHHRRVYSQPEVCPGEEADLIDVDSDFRKPGAGGGGGGGGGGFTAPAVGMPMPMPMPMPTAFNYPPPKGAVSTLKHPRCTKSQN